MSDGPNLSKGGVAIPGYEVEKELGRGGFAVVYRAQQPKLRRTVALKVLTNVDPSDEDAKRRFEAECQAIGSLSWHPHVVTVYDAGATEEGLPFLAMENLPSGSLQAKLADHGPAPWEEVLRVTVQMCDALGAAHQAGILHRDIKPANVLTSRIGDYKLADFGIARFGDTQRTATGVITGTVAYSAPEVLRGARASSASDVYALGAMLCAVATGQTPFVKEADESVVAIMYRVNTEDPPDLTEHGVPEDLALLVRTLMDKDPEKRPASALEVAQWAQHIQEQRGIPSSPLHTDPDMEPGLPAAAIAAGAAAIAGASAVAPAPTTTPPPVTYGTPAPATSYTPAPATSYTPAPQPAPQPEQWGVGTPAPPSTYGGQASAGYSPQTTYGQASTGYDPQTGAYGPQTGYGYAAAPEEPGGSGKLIAIVAVVAVVLVALVLIITQLVAGGDGSAADRPDVGRVTTTTEAGSETSAPDTTAPDTTAPDTTAPDTTAPPTTAPPTTAAGGPGGLSQPVYDSLVSSCQSTGGQEDYCRCVADAIAENYTDDELAALAGDITGSSLPPELQDIANSCLGGN